jgi:hypothetical protein
MANNLRAQTQRFVKFSDNACLVGVDLIVHRLRPAGDFAWLFQRSVVFSRLVLPFADL